MIGFTAAEGSFDVLVEMVAVNRSVLLAWALSIHYRIWIKDVTGLTTENGPLCIISIE